MLITDSAELADFCRELASAPYLAVDTEFLRERTYYAQLCLVQVAYGDHAAAIDTLAPGLELGPLRDLLCDTDAVKVFHAATQDLEIFLNVTGEVPGPVFDTQIAASVCGHGEQPGYASLVEQILGISVDKASQNTDWTLRPLSDRQLGYALGDVTHLCKVYESLLDELERTGRADWVHEEMAALLEPSKYQMDPQQAWRRIKIRRPKRQSLAVLREVCAWRETEAMRINVPRSWVVRDEALSEIAQNIPQSMDDLARVRALKPQQARGAHGEALLDAVDRALESPEDSWPEIPPRRPPISGHESMVALLQALLRLRCEKHGVAMSVVAKRRDLDRIATEDNPDVPTLKGWRRKIFGDDAMALRAGKLALTGNGRNVEAVYLED